MPAWTGAIGVGLSGLLARRRRRLSDAAFWQRETQVVQARQLRGLLSRAAGTEFGRGHGFERLARISGDAELVAAYRAAVPVADYEAFRPLVARMREGGERDVLWPGRVEHFAQTSGTTAGDKYIPVSAEMLKSNYRAALDIFAHAGRFGVSLPGMLTGQALFLGGSTTLETNGHGIKTGDLSGLVTPLIRWPISEIYLPGPEIALMSHWPSKIEAMARACVGRDVRMVNGMPSWMLVLFERVVELARERAKDPGSIRSLRDVWPNLRLLVHGGVKYAPFEPRVRQAWSGSADGPDVPARLELYPASEGFIAMQDTRGDPGLRLMADIGNFYEFVPLERVHEAAPPAYTAGEVEPGVRYVVCMSTCAGLWRYVIGDVVEFDTVPDGARRRGTGPARLRIVGRHKHFINAFGENLIVEHIENAVAEAAKAAGLVVGEFTAGPVYPGVTPEGDARRAGLELVFETPEAGAMLAARLAAFGVAFDASLKRQNVDYTTKRTDGVGMAEPTLSPVAMGAFHRWMQSRGKLGGQHKCPRCANHRDFVEGVLGLAGGAQVRSAGRGAAAARG